MRIDFVITEMFVGGAERCLTELAVGMNARGHRVRVLSIGTLPQGEQQGLLDRLRDAGITVDAANADGAWQVLRARKKLRQWFRSDPPDLCQTFLYHANVLGTFVAHAQGIPVVGGLRVADPSPIRVWIERLAVQRMKRLVCVSEATRQFALEKLSGRGEALVTIGNAVDVQRFATADPANWQELGWPTDAKVVLFVGRFHPQKGMDILQEHAESFLRDSGHRLLLIGDGPLRQDLEDWASRFPESQVKVLPWQSDVAPWVKASHVLVLPSRFEGMPNVVLEAMASGKPVVSSNAEGSQELLSHRRSEQVFDRGDGATMSQLIRNFLAEDQVASQIGQENETIAREKFSIEAMLDAYEQLYQSIVTSE